MKVSTVFTGLTAAAVMAAGAVGAQELRIATGQPDSHAHSYGLQRFAAYLEENSDITTQLFLMELLSLSEIPDGLRDGIAEVGCRPVTSWRSMNSPPIRLPGASCWSTVTSSSDKCRKLEPIP
ncbi:hypothetical protein LCGC14_2937390 [marine sediment metagenome]|uniref:Uncharacterized protein n=1 Tax=marine sediment metagenome TaxID=412755 RepID=A0A0F8XJ11_9ZZZZ